MLAAKIIRNILSLITTLVALFGLYLDKLWIHLSVIQTEVGKEERNNQKERKFSTINRTYLTTLVTFTLDSLYGIFGLHLASGQSLTMASLQQSNYIYWRSFFYSRKIWPQMDTVFCIVTIGPMLVLLDLTFKRPIALKYRFIIDDKESVKLAGKALSISESTKLIAIFGRCKIVYKISGLSVFICSLLYSEVMVFLVSKVYIVAFWWSVTFWVLEYTFILFIMILFVFDNLTHIIVSGSCIQIRQQHHCRLFTRLFGELAQKRPTARQFQRLWPRYLAFNRAVLSIALQLEAFNTFYTNYLTVIFLVYNIIQVMYAHVIFFSPTASTSMVLTKCLFVVFLIQTITLLFGLFEYCARVVKRNGQIGRLNRVFAVHCLQHQRRYRLRVGQLLKMELLQWSKLLHFYAFKLFGDSRITSKTFYVMVIDISCFFLFVTKRMQ